jgi:hypothetical protein
MDTENFDSEIMDPVEYDGQVDGMDEAADYESEPEYINLDDYADKYVKVTVDGEELEVPFKEAVSGYQRQADYTRKTQQLAEERRNVQFAQAIQQALDNDPNATIDLLKNHYGLNEVESFEEDDIFADPLEKQYRQLESRIRSFEEQQAMTELENNIYNLQQKYGEDFDANDVVAQALAMGTTNLEAVYKQSAFDRLYSREQAQRQMQTQRQEQEQKIVQAKRSGGIVAGGSSSQGTSVDSQPITSLRDAFASAKQQLGIS